MRDASHDSLALTALHLHALQGHYHCSLPHSFVVCSEQTSQPLDRLMKPDPNPKGPAIHADRLQAIEDDEKMVL